MYDIASGVVSVVVGDGVAGLSDGFGRTSRINSPRSLLVRRQGTLVFNDINNNQIRMVNLTSGILSLQCAFSSLLVVIFVV